MPTRRGRPVVRPPGLRPVRGRSVLAGVAVLAAGFGALNLFWWAGHGRRDLPGLWDFRSATVGDGLLLPVAAILLVVAGSALPPAPHEPAIVAGSGALGVGAGAALMLLWLRDPDPVLNWTMPAPHTFNAAGWYHAAFLAGASGFFSAAAMRLFWRARARRATHPVEVEAMLRTPGASVLVGCLLGFVGLVAADSSSAWAPLTCRTATGAVVAGTGLASGLLVWGFGGGVARAWRQLGLGVVLAAALSLAAERLPVSSAW